VALVATCVVPEAGVTELTEKVAGGVEGLLVATDVVWRPLLHPVKRAKGKMAERAREQKGALRRNMLDTASTEYSRAFLTSFWADA